MLERVAAGVHHRDTLKKLTTALKPPDDKIDLVLAAVLIARLDNEELDVAAYEGEVSRLAGEVKRTLNTVRAPRQLRRSTAIYSQKTASMAVAATITTARTAT